MVYSANIKSMRDAVVLVMNMNKFTRAARKVNLQTVDHDEMRLKFLTATASPPQKRLQTFLTNRLIQRRKYTNEEEEALEDGSSSNASKEDMDYYENNQNELEKFYQQLAYDLPESPKASHRMAELAKPTPKLVINTYRGYKYIMGKGHKKRMQRTVAKLKAMTTEDLEKYIQNQKTKSKDTEKIRKRRSVIYRLMLTRLEKQCREKFLDNAFQKFSRHLARCAIMIEGKVDIAPVSIQRLINCIEFNICQACKVKPEDHKMNASLYTSIASFISWLIVEMLFVAQNVSDKEGELFDSNQQVASNKSSTSKINTLKKRAMIAAKKKTGAKSKAGLMGGPPPKIDEIVKLSSLIGCL